MPGSVCVKIWYSLRLDAESKRMDGGDIAFNELVKECLFVHGWNERTGRIYDPNPKLSAMPHYVQVQVQPRMEWKTEEWEEEGVSGVFR